MQLRMDTRLRWICRLRLSFISYRAGKNKEKRRIFGGFFFVSEVNDGRAEEQELFDEEEEGLRMIYGTRHTSIFLLQLCQRGRRHVELSPCTDREG